MRVYFAVGIGGMIGASMRHLVTNIYATLGDATFPWATWTVNLLGAFLLTYLLFQVQSHIKLNDALFTSITVGIIGSFTTFSTMTIETVYLLNQNMLLAFLYVLSTIFGGLFFSYCGYRLAVSR